MHFIIAGLFALCTQQGTADTTRLHGDSVSADSARARRAQRLEGVQVSAIRARTAALSERTLGRAEIQSRFTGQETPILLQRAPGVTAYSESGSASNYSYIRLRGIDQTRINITLDGIPLNEPEDQSLYFSNFPDFANSIASVQVQRGVGSSAPGTASYAGSVNFQSVPVAAVERGGEMQLAGGSYDTRRASVSLQSGLTASGYAAYLRSSAQETDGYRFNSGNRSRSTFGSVGWFGVDDIVKLSLLAGLSSNDQAYYASPFTTLALTPRDNPFGNRKQDEVTDRFHQDLVSTAWTHAFSATSSLATTLYGFDAGGWYDYPGDNGLTDAYHYRLHSRWGGVTSAYEWQGESASGSLGVNASRYQREHWLTQRPDLETRFYDNTGHKAEQSVFAKGSASAGRFTYSADAQLRLVQFRYQPTAGNGVQSARADWTFFNPKAGVVAQLARGLSAYLTAGANGREPTRSDMLAGQDDVDSVAAKTLLPLTRVRPERVYDVESGVTLERGAVRAQANVFLMQFRNEIAAIGAISELGYELRKNVDRSARQGLEASAEWAASNSLSVTGDVSVTAARIQDYRDDRTGVSYHDVTPLMTPKFISNHGVRSELAPWLRLDLDGRYVSRMMLTNTNDPRFVVPPSWYADGGATLRSGRHSVLIQVRNILDRRVYTGGYPDASTTSTVSGAQEPYLYILAPRNVSINAHLVF